MARISTVYVSLIIIVSLILIIIPATFAVSRFSSDGKHENFDVSGSLKQALHVFSSKKPSAKLSKTLTFSLGTAAKTKNSSLLSFALHSRTSLLSSNYYRHEKNYTSLTLSRLARDSARVHSILSRHSLSLQGVSISDLKPVDTVVLKPQQLESPVTSGASQGSGEYFARVGLGQPVKEVFMVIDTGSDVSWLQCQPCSDCYNQTGPIYNPSASSTYKKLPCNSQQCDALQISACRMNNCLYQVSYGDGSFTVGEYVTETMSFGGGAVQGIAIGCGHDNEGLFTAADGLLGMGGGPLSLASQIKATSFSYCLVNRDSGSSSTLEFNSAHPSDSVLAPLLQNSLINTYHYVGLTGINIGGQAIDVPSSLFEIGGDGKGGVIVDSGTAVTRLRTEAYTKMRDAFKRNTQSLPSSSGFALFDTCYDLSSVTTANVPTVSFEFAGGKSLRLRPNHYIIPVDDAGKFCFAFAPTSGSLSIIGNIQQQGTRVSYDLANKYVGFSPNKC